MEIIVKIWKYRMRKQFGKLHKKNQKFCATLQYKKAGKKAGKKPIDIEYYIYTIIHYKWRLI